MVDVVVVPRKRRTTTLQRDKSKHGFIVKSNTMDPPTAPIFLPLFHCTENGTVRWDEFTLFLESSSHRNYTQRDHHHPHWIPVARSVVVSANRAKVVVFFVTVVWENDKDYTDRLTDWRWWWKEHHGNASVHSECNCSLRWYSFLVLAAIDVGIPLLWNHQLSLPLSLSSGIYFWYTTVCPSFVCHRATFKIGSYLFAVQNFKF